MKKIKRLPAGMIIFVICCALGYKSNFAFWQSNLLYEGESIYNYLQVYDDDRAIYFSTNVLFGIQSVYLKEKGLTGYYYDYAMAAPFMAGVNEKDSLDILILGNGTGTFATQCERYFDKTLNITGVEIDEKITELAKKYFELPDNIEVVTYDGRAYLNAIDKKYDVIMVDAYQDITIPFQMSSVEFFSSVKDHLKDDGVMVVNMNMKSNQEGGINEYLSDTICTVFNEAYYADTSAIGNRELFASNNPELLVIFEKNVSIEDDSELIWMMDLVSEKLIPYEAGDLVMTDDKAPVELLGMKVIDEIIQAELAYYKNVFKEGGIKAVIENL